MGRRIFWNHQIPEVLRNLGKSMALLIVSGVYQPAGLYGKQRIFRPGKEMLPGPPNLVGGQGPAQFVPGVV